LSSEEQSQNQDSNKDQTYYARKKNWISGVDNDTVNLLLGGAALVVGTIAAYPVAKNIWDNFTQRVQQQQANGQQQQQLPNGEAYIPPTEPLPPPAVPPVQQPANIVPQTDQSTEQTGQSNDQKEDNEDDGLFHETELRRRQKLMGRRPSGSRYESPFGKDIGGLG
jgi:hypothetical protein